MILAKAAEAERFLNQPPRAIRAAIIYGRDRSGVRERAERLAAKLVPDVNDAFAVGVIGDAESDQAERLDNELSALSLLGGPRLVRLQMAEKAAADRAATEALKAHLDGRGNPDAFFLIEAGALGKDSGIRRAAEASKIAVCMPVYEDEAGDIARLTRESLAREGVGLTSEALDMFVGRLPRERGVVRQEIERLVLYLGPGSGTVGDPDLLAAHLGATAESSMVQAASDAAGARARPALEQLARAAAEGEGGVAAVRVLGQHLARLRRIRIAVDGGAQAQAAAKSAGVFWKAEREVLRQHRAWTADALDRGQADVATADQACKSAGSPDLLLAERLYLTVAGQARRLGL